jgi:hypothetical protein
MNPRNETKLHGKIAAACEATLSTAGYVTPVDALLATGWLAPGDLTRWRNGHVPYLERVVTASLPKISTAMRLFRRWATERGLRPSQTSYVTATRARRPLRFSKSGAPAIERAYHTRWS